MKKLIRLGLGIAIFCLCSGFFSCKNYIDTLSLAGYSYELNNIEIKSSGSSIGDNNEDSSEEIKSTISFEKDGESVTVIFDSSSKSFGDIGDFLAYLKEDLGPKPLTLRGTYAVDNDTKTISLTLDNEKTDWVLNYEKNKLILERPFIVSPSDKSYPQKDGTSYLLSYIRIK